MIEQPGTARDDIGLGGPAEPTPGSARQHDDVEPSSMGRAGRIG
jgi:hypothetical protein